MPKVSLIIYATYHGGLASLLKRRQLSTNSHVCIHSFIESSGRCGRVCTGNGFARFLDWKGEDNWVFHELPQCCHHGQLLYLYWHWNVTKENTSSPIRLPKVPIDTPVSVMALMCNYIFKEVHFSYVAAHCGVLLSSYAITPLTQNHTSSSITLVVIVGSSDRHCMEA